MSTLPEVTEISENVVPVTKEDKIHSYQIPSDDCFAHLEVQFRFYALYSNVERVLGRTTCKSVILVFTSKYWHGYSRLCRVLERVLGVAMPVVGGEYKYKTTSLVSADCFACVFTQAGMSGQTDSRVMVNGKLDCTGNTFCDNGIVCRQ